MKNTRLFVPFAILSVFAGLLAGCTRAAPSQSTKEYRSVPVERGNLTVQVTSTGSLVYSDRRNLSFDATGTIGDIMVEVGDEVTAGQILATLDKDDWQTYLDGLQKTLTTAQRQPPSKTIDLLQSQANVQTAIDSLNSLQSVKQAYDDLAAAQQQLQVDQGMLQLAMMTTPEDPASWPTSALRSGPVTFWTNVIANDKTKVADLTRTLNDTLAGANTNLTVDINQQIKNKQNAIDIAKKRVDVAQVVLDDANKAAADAQIAYDEAKATNIQIVSPFDGVVTAVPVIEKANIRKGATALVVADSAKFQAEMLVNEMDVLKISSVTPASIQLSALSGVSFPAKVTTIAPVATVQQGVVNYKVKAEIYVTQVAAQPSTSSQPASEATQKTLKLVDEQLAQAVKNGRITQAQSDALRARIVPLIEVMTPAQIEQMITRAVQGGAATQAGQAGQGALRNALGNLTPEQLAQLRQNAQQGQTSQQPASAQSQTTSTEGIRLREGLSVTVSLTIQQKKNVLFVPNQAITVKGGKSTVIVDKDDGTQETRAITTGISDWQNTEVVSGLSQGETVSIAKTTVATVSKTTQTQSGIRIPGVGGGGLLGGK